MVLVSGLRTITVDTSGGSYDVVVGRGARRELPRLLPEGARRIAVVKDERLDVELPFPLEHVVVELEGGEEAKTLATLERVARAFAAFGLTRRDVVVALGGGAVSDVAGFAASTWHRGTAVLNVATTLLAQVDAAIGGKTGVNLPEGKNLLGTFWQPRGVVCDTELLDTLPEEEWRSGFGEVAKYAFLGATSGPSAPLEEQIAECVAIKAAIVGSDEREAGRRSLLNYGHTLAHAMEAAALDAGTPLRHGEAVAVGLVFAARLAEALGRISRARVREHEDVVSAYGLSHELPSGFSAAELISFMARDKKSGGTLAFVLDGGGGLEVVHGVDEAIVRATLREMGAR